ncbi:glycosyl hydrolase [Caproiciproducens galactitolivorans]|uniref:Alpha-xylosidase n=1 Tax=Caproiciproducens galactitolivorans TaxID=642589 RepID=A0A4Z0Y8U2_9FIRM|nr:TIM-barrel domain-containing protein [Caproiciproducens galactitolivorans]QEY34934.1 glycosyl hydrolase [Caproiciproducens galactitolivorans]TGJ76358.1 alpha-xylosidase [Caproiciproducens galactitolivorans]
MERITFSKKKACLSFPFCGHSAQLQWSSENEDGILIISLPYDAAYGMGEKYNFLNQKGHQVVNCIEEQFCHQEDKTYCSAPFFLTNTGFGLYIETDCKTIFDFGEQIVISMPTDAAVILFSGTPETIISEYMSLFGPAKLPPKWVLGPWISANHWDTQEKVEEQIAKLNRYHFPTTVLVLEAWSDESTFYIFNGAKYTPVSGSEAFNYFDFDFSDSPWPDPRSMIENLHNSGIHLILWQIPVYKKQNPDEPVNTQNENDRAFAVENRLCVHTDKGLPYEIPKGHWFSGSMIPDFTNSETRRIWFSKRQYLLDIGVDGFKTDGGEFIYRTDLHFKDGSTGTQMKNRYSQSYTSAYTEFIGEDHVLFSRAGYAGQHTTPILWAGDQQSENNELKSVLRAGLSAAMTGIPFWGFDIAGFSGSLPTLDLYRRATQLACFCPVMQWHSEPDGGQFRDLMPTGSDNNNERSPWNLAEVYGAPDFVNEMRFWHNLRMNLLPYLYNTALDCVKQYRPMIRPLAYAFPNEQAALGIEDEFLLGESLLVAPILEENAQCRFVYLPDGIWYNLFTGEKILGGRTVESVCTLHLLPVYLRAGYGIALNLDDSQKLGSSVGNGVDSYHHLIFFLAGDTGSFHFHDNLGNDFTLTWDTTGWKKSGCSICPFTVRIIH